MGGGAQELTGPDFGAGVPLDDLEDGGMVQGHAHGEAVLVVRQGTELFALDAFCTHYGVPLAGGIVVDGMVRCPGHHACFSLRTGEAVRAPALRPAGCWEVELQGGQVVVTGKREAPAPATTPTAAAPSSSTPSAGEPRSVVIVGAGAAGSAAAEMLRREGFGGTVTLVDAGEDAPYDRPNLSKDYLAGTAPEEWIPLWPREPRTRSMRCSSYHSRVARIEVAEKRVRLMNGRALEWDALLLATGSEPVRLPVVTRGFTHVHSLRTLADSRAIVRAAEGARRAVVVGSSFIGLEVAASLVARGLEVSIVSHEELPLSHVMGPEVGRFLQALHERHGVRFHLRETVTAVDAEAVTLKGGATLPADLVVVGIGVRPGVALATWAGLAVENGVVVDEQLRTSAPGIWAAGDVCRWPDPWTGERIRSEHWVVAQRQGQTAARNILGRGERFAAVPFFWSQHYDTTIHYVGHAEKWDAIEVDGSLEGGDCTLTFRLGGRPLAVATVSRDRVGLRAEAAMERGDLAALEAVLSPHPRAPAAA